MSADVHAQAYPAKPVRVIVPAAPGSTTDLMFRVVSSGMSAALGQQFIADYRPGAGGMLGTAGAAKSPPDGYTLAVVAAGFVVNPSMTKNMPYDPTRDFTPLGMISDVPSTLVVHPSLPVRNVKELITLARARPGQLNSGSSGQGSNSHLAGLLFNQLANVKIMQVPYKSSSLAVTDLMGGHIEISFFSAPGVVEHARNGRLRMLAQAGATRSPTLPEIPTMQEAGLRDFQVNSVFAAVGPAAMPAAIVERLNSALVRTIQDASVRKMLLDSGAEPIGSTPGAHDAFIKSEVARWRKVAAQAGIVPQ